MNFDDTARFFGPSDKLWPELFAPPSKDASECAAIAANVK